MGSFREVSRCLSNEGYINVERKMSYLNKGCAFYSHPLFNSNSSIQNPLVNDYMLIHQGYHVS
ncbi:hypothetical protein [Clostridium sp.]|uniref:hypothetical protein n=1 Tax=Clostridium sp. TaxID=1506 RepID=UPI00261C7245|nr:hypothetical protein [Clostridium sp.]